MGLVRHRQTKETEQIGFTYGRPRQSSTLHLLKGFCCFFPLASAFFKFSFNLNFTILLIRLKGIGFSNAGDCNNSARLFFGV